MDLYPSEEQHSLTAVAARLASTSFAPESGEGSTDLTAEHWTTAAEAGWFAIGTPEELGGEGGGLADLALVFKEIGKAAVPGPLLFTSLAAYAAALMGVDAAPALQDGRMRAGITVSRQDSGSSQPLVFGNGDLGMVVDIDEAEGSVVLRDVAHTEWTHLDSVDPALGVRTGVFGEQLGRIDGDTAHAVMLRAAVLSSALLAGNAAGTAAMATEYAKVREQFGKPIGSFQAVSHSCADMAIAAAAAQSVVDFAAVSIDEATDSEVSHTAELAVTVAAARMFAEEAALSNARDNIQNHGAIGFTTEHKAHRYLKSARAYSQMVMPRAAQIAMISGARN